MNMTTSDRLEELKRQVRETSNQRYQIQQQRYEMEDRVNEMQMEQEQIDQEIKNLVLSITGQRELSEAREREILKDNLESFALKQQIMNRQLIDLNEMLASTDALEALYRTKRQELEYNYKNQEMALRGQLNELEKRMENQQDKIASLDKEIDNKNDEIQVIEENLKERKFLETMKKTWVDKWLPMMTAGFMAVFLGGFLGWGTYGIANQIFQGLINLIKG